MTPIAAHARVETPVQPIALHDRVRVPDGRTGSVIGFYRTEDESVLVLFNAGDSYQFPLDELAKLA